MRLLSLRLVAGMLAAALLIAGCGGSDDSGSSDSSGSGAGSLTHVDGIVVVQGDGFVLTPIDGSDDITFTLGPEVQVGQVKAIEVTGAPARVSYRPGETVAAAVVPAPRIGDDLESYAGTVEKVSDSSITIDGPDGTRTFDISGADDGAFDTAHLKDHKAEQSPVKIYYDPKAPDVGVAYEDA